LPRPFILTNGRLASALMVVRNAGPQSFVYMGNAQMMARADGCCRGSEVRLISQLAPKRTSEPKRHQQLYDF
jgi:hypothetical protein